MIDPWLSTDGQFQLPTRGTLQQKKVVMKSEGGEGCSWSDLESLLSAIGELRGVFSFPEVGLSHLSPTLPRTRPPRVDLTTRRVVYHSFLLQCRLTILVTDCEDYRWLFRVLLDFR